jgi:hypothetical protein
LLPALARLLKVDLNTLLCFNEGLSEQEISHFSREVIDTSCKSGFTMEIERIQEYPNCGLLIHSAALHSGFENNPEYAFLHSDTEFQQLIEQYRVKC